MLNNFLLTDTINVTGIKNCRVNYDSKKRIILQYKALQIFVWVFLLKMSLLSINIRNKRKISTQDKNTFVIYVLKRVIQRLSITLSFKN